MNTITYSDFLTAAAAATRYDTPVVIKTDDCLHDYYELLSLGIQPASGLQYTPQGLAFELRDALGNEYHVLEERRYSDYE